MLESIQGLDALRDMKQLEKTLKLDEITKSI
jgi:hypothetical protein